MADDQWILTHLDQWAGLSHKASMGSQSKLDVAPTWVPEDDKRRLNAYTVLDAYRRNAARVLLDADDDEKTARREYGDPNLLIARIVGAVLGDTQTITVQGAATRPDNAPDLPPAPMLPDEPTPVDRRIYAAQVRLHDDTVDEILTEWEDTASEYPARSAQQTALRNWAGTEAVIPKILEWNRSAVTLGDGVIELAASTRKQRPTLTVHDPGFYFPVLDGVGADDFPETVHLAWEFDDGDVRMVRRRTYRLVHDATSRSYPWQPGVSSTTTVLMSDGVWPLDKVEGVTIADLSDASATWQTTEDGTAARDIDLGIDFIPVVHLPNTPASETHWGESVLTALAQLFDDVQEADTDLRAAGGLAAVPILAFSGTRNGPTDFFVEPGATVSLGEGGRLDVLTMAETLPALQARVDGLLDRAAVNSRVSADALGRINTSDGMSGIAMLLSFAPFVQLVGELRLTRVSKHPLLLRFAARMMQLTGQIEPGEVTPAAINLGSFIPSDLSDVTKRIVALVQVRAISVETALTELAAAGMQVGDIPEEIARIRAQDSEGARAAAEATTSSQVAADWLGITLPDAPQPPTVTLPGRDQ